jgi:NO-binding membrane sensor protein with MHYT domain
MNSRASRQIKALAIVIFVLGIAMLAYWGMSAIQGIAVAGVPILSEMVNAALALICGIGLLRLRRWLVLTSLFLAGMWAY